MIRAAPTLLFAAVVTLAACKTSPEDRLAGPGDPPSAGAASTAQSPGGAGAGSGGATPAASRDGMGATGNTPAQQREHAGMPGTTSQKPSVAEAGGQCTEDADCAISRYIPGSCCQDCEERPVTRSELKAQNERCREDLMNCPMRNCAPGRMGRGVACVQGRCSVRAAPN